MRRWPKTKGGKEPVTVAGPKGPRLRFKRLREAVPGAKRLEKAALKAKRPREGKLVEVAPEKRGLEIAAPGIERPREKLPGSWSADLTIFALAVTATCFWYFGHLIFS